MPTKLISFKYKRPSISITPDPEPSQPIQSPNSEFTQQLTTARDSIQFITSNKTASFLDVYLYDPALTPASSPTTFLNNLHQFQSVTPQSELQWKEDAYGTVNVLKTWRGLFKALDHRKRYLRRVKRDGNNGSAVNPGSNESEEQVEEGSIEEEGDDNSEESVDASEDPRKRRRLK